MQTESPPLPPRLAWFAPWRWFAHWRPWKRWTLLVTVVLVVYLLSPFVVAPVVNRLMSAGYKRSAHGLGSDTRPNNEPRKFRTACQANHRPGLPACHLRAALVVL